MSEFPVRGFAVEAIHQHPGADNLTLVKLLDHERELVANKRDDGSFRYTPGDVVIFYPVGAILLRDLLEEMGAWDETKGKGTLASNRGNRVGPRKFASIDGSDERYESRGALRPLKSFEEGGRKIFFVERNGQRLEVEHGTVVQDFLGIEEYRAA